MAMTIKMRKPAETAEPELDAPQIETAPASPVLSAYSAPVSTESFAIAAIAGLVACVLFATLLVMQSIELSYYKQPPAAFPLSGAGIAVSAVTPTPAPAPAAEPAAAPAPAGS